MRTFVIRLTLLTGIIATSACSGNSTSASMTPAAPSSNASATAQMFSTTAPSANSQAAAHLVAEKHDDQDQLEGVIASIDTPGRSILVGGTTVTVPTTAVIRHGHTMLTFADLTVADRVHVKGTKSGATLVASEINVQRPPTAASEHIAVSGPVSALAGTCPAVTFTVNGTTVTTTSTTKFRNGSCSQLAAGIQVTARGTAQPDGSIQAVTVTLPEASDDHDSDR